MNLNLKIGAILLSTPEGATLAELVEAMAVEVGHVKGAITYGVKHCRITVDGSRLEERFRLTEGGREFFTRALRPRKPGERREPGIGGSQVGRSVLDCASKPPAPTGREALLAELKRLGLETMPGWVLRDGQARAVTVAILP
jgi:hypothetical protein